MSDYELEARARLLCERAGIPWANADAAAWVRLAELESAEIHAHDPDVWQAAVAAVAIGGGLAVMVWVLAFGGLR